MMRLFAKALMLVGFLTISTQLLALGLGELTLRSALNQPLEAEIELVDSEGLSQWEIKPLLASDAAFQRAGVDRPYFLTKVKFTVEGDRIRLTTRDPVTEPFLNFLVELNWPSGRVLREYTVLLDPPTFAEETYQPLVNAPANNQMGTTQFQGGSNQPATRPSVPAPTSRSNQPRQVSQDIVDQPGTYQVQPNDTLWGIALRTRPSRGVTPQQMMVALQDENPEAFIGGNINRLKTHHVLRIPEQDKVNGITFDVAVSEVARQNRELSTGAAQLDATGRQATTNTGARDSAGGEVKLVSAQSREARSAGASGDVSSGSGARQEALENELAITLEDLDKNRRENKDLRDRLGALEEQISALQRLISLKDSQLANMQATASQQNAGNPEATADAVPGSATTPASVAAVDSASREKTPVGQATAAKPQMATAPVESVTSVNEQAATVPEQKQPPVAPRKPYSPPSPPPSFLDTLLKDPITLVGGLGAILLLVVVTILYLRKRKETQSEEDELAEAAVMAEPIPLDSDDPLAKGSDALDNNAFDDFNFQDLPDDNGDLMSNVDLSGDLLSDPETPVDASDLVVSGETVVSEKEEPATDGPVDDSVDVSGLDFGDEEDDLFELVDLDVAYGRFDVAVEKLEGALALQPGRTDVRLRLLELLVEMGDSERFFEQENTVIELGDSELVQQASDLRQLLSDPIEPTATGQTESSADDIATDIDLSIDQLGQEFNESLDDGISFGDALDISDSDKEITEFDFDDSVSLDDLDEFSESSELSDNSSGDDGVVDLDDLEAEFESELPNSELTADSDETELEFDLSGFEEPQGDDEPEEQAEEDSAENLMEFDLSGLEDAESTDSDEQGTAADDSENAMEFDLDSLAELTDVDIEDEESEVIADDSNTMDFESDVAVSDVNELESITSDEDRFEEESQVDFDLTELESLSAEDLDSVETSGDDAALLEFETQPETAGDVATSVDHGVSLEALMDSDETDHGEFDLSGLQEIDNEFSSDQESQRTGESELSLDDLDELPELDSLEELEELDATSATDDSIASDVVELDTLPELEELPELDSLEELEEFEELDVASTDSDSNVTNIAELDALSELEELPELGALEELEDLDAALTDSDSNVADITELDALPELEELPELGALEELEELDAALTDSDSNVADITELDALSELEELPELDALEELEDVDAALTDSDSNVAGIAELDALSELEELPELGALEELEDVDAALTDSDSSVAGPTELDALPELDDLSELEELPELGALEELEDLDAALTDSDSSVAGLAELDALPDLEELPELDAVSAADDSSEGDVADLNALPELDALPELEELDALEEFEKLDVALAGDDSSVDGVSDLDALPELEALSELDTLPELEELPELGSLEELDVASAGDDANVSDLSDLDALPELEALPELDVTSGGDDANVNDVSDLDALPELDELPELDVLEELEELEVASMDDHSSSNDVTDLDSLPELDELSDLEELPELGDVAVPELDTPLSALENDGIPELVPLNDVVAPANTPSVAPVSSVNDIDLDALASAEDEFDFLAGTDECETKLELAQEYLNLEDEDGARDLLGEVVAEGTDPQKQKARELLDTFA